MNHIYRLIWSQVLNAWLAVAENSRGKGKGRSRQLAAVALSLSAALVQAAPLGGQVASGTGSISQTGATTTIQQSSQNLSLNWQSFNVASQETVNFAQPSASAIAVNRIFDTNGSQILGHLNANGQVYLINPNGVLFGQGAQVNVGGLVASTLDLNDASLNGNTRSFSGSGTGSIVNQGTLNATNGGYIALLGNKVSNQGTISAQLGTVALGAGSAATLTFNGNSLLHMQVDRSTLNNLAENRQLIQANGGQVIMSAGAKDSLLASVVNNSGIIEARTVDNHEGVITLLGGMKAGTVNVVGMFDASAPNGGNGGQIETSAAHVKVADDAKVTTAAATGRYGNWLIDPQNYTVAASGGDITGAALSTNLGTTAITLQSSSGGTAGSGNVNINDAVTWSANTTLTLTASNNITINKNITATGNTAGLALNPNTTNGTEAASGTGTYSLGNGASITLSGTSPSLSISGVAYTVINSLGVAGDTSATTLQGIRGNLTGHYALGSNIDASATSGWNNGAGFTPIGSFSGMFDGLGHTVSGLTINTPSSDRVGLFGYVSNTGTLQNVGMLGDSVSGHYYVGGLAGYNAGMISNAYATGSVVGGSGNAWVGGLVGLNYGTLSNTYATGSVRGSGSTYMGGLVGDNYSGTIINSYSTGSVTGDSGSAYIGGLVGFNNGTVSNVYSTSSVTGGSYLGGLVGDNYTGTVSNAYATGNAAGGSGSGFVGGLVGLNHGTVSNAYAMGNVSGGTSVGGLVGDNLNGTVSNTYATGSVSGNFAIGGLAGYNNGTFNNSYWNSSANALGIGSGTVTGATGLTTVQMQTASNFAGFNFTTTPGATGNNWVMVDVDGSLNNAGGMAGATRPMLASEYSTTINNAHQLQLMAMSPSASYTLAQNIDATATASGKDVWSSAGFVPVGNYSANFTGTFDGLSHTINGLTINTPSSYYSGGVFGYVGKSGTVQNVGVLGVSVFVDAQAGGLVGNNSGTISNAYATGSVNGTSNVGGLVGSNYFGTISNSYATGSVSGSGNAIGGLVGFNYGTINNVYASSNVNVIAGPSSAYVGGLVGNNFSGTISNSYATGNVTGAGSSSVGGLVGSNGGTISNAYATGSVSGDFYDGGLVGISGGTIGNAYATGNVKGTSYVGGLVGDNDHSTISNAYASGSVSGTIYVGGLVGVNGTTSTISNAYATGSVSGTTDVGGLVGVNNGILSNAFYNVDQVNINGGSLLTAGGIYNAQYQDWISHDQALNIVNYSSLQTGSGGYYNVSSIQGLKDMLGFSESSTYNFRLTSNIDLSSVPGFYIPYFSGTFDGNSNVISNLVINVMNDNIGVFGQLIGSLSNLGVVNVSVTGNNNVGGLAGFSSGKINNAYATGSVTGAAMVGGLVGINNGTISNSNATGIVQGQNEVGGLVGINNGTISNSNATGIVQGQNEVGGLVGSSGNSGNSIISNAYATGNVNGQDFVGGLVGYDWQGGAISHSYATGNVNGHNEVGGLTGNNAGSISSAYATGSVSGITYVGGLVGYNLGPISNAYATGSVSGTSYVGGLVGLNNGGSTSPISNAYASGSVSGASYVGGLVGVSIGPISNAYATGSVSGTTDVGGLVGLNNGGTIYKISNSFWNIDIDTTGVGFGSTTGATGLTTTQMQTQASFSSWDFANTWVMYDGHTYPLLRSFMTPLTVTANDAVKTYDGQAYSGGNGLSYSVTPNGNLLGTVSYGGSAQGAVNVNSYIIAPTGGLYSNQQGYIISYANGTLTVNPATITVTGTEANNKVYDGTTTATLTGGKLNGVVPGDTLTLNQSGLFATKNVGTNIMVTATDSLNGTTAGNYTLIQPTGLAADITPASLSVIGTTASNKVYDGTTAAMLSGGTLSGVFGSDSVALNQSGSFATKNAGTGLAVTTTDSLSGASASNYALTQPTGLTADITPKPIAVTATGVNKTYDGTINDPAKLSSTGIVSGDSVTLAYASASFVDKNVGTNKSVTVSGIAASGTDAGNYSLDNMTASTVASITPASLSVTGTATHNKGYDGTTNAMLTGGTLSGVIVGDTVTLNQSGTFATKSVGTNIAVTATDSLGGTSSDNYTLIQPTGLAADITAALLSVTGTAAHNKVYDGTAVATLTGGTLVGVAVGDSVTLTQAGAFATRNAGTGIAVTATDGLGGASASNYTLAQPTGLAANITPASLSVTGTIAHNKVYDGTSSAMLTGGTLSGVILGDSVALAQTGTFATKYAGSDLAVTATDSLNGTSAGNYALTQPTGLMADITPKPITATATGVNKVYDGTINDPATLMSSGVISGDTVNLNYASATFADKSIGTNKPVSVSGINATGTDAGNYTVNVTASTTANIMPRLAIPQMEWMPPSSRANLHHDEFNLPSSAYGIGAQDNVISIGTMGPIVHIENGGVKLPTKITKLSMNKNIQYEIR